jgi:hypothetical protein
MAKKTARKAAKKSAKTSGRRPARQVVVQPATPRPTRVTVAQASRILSAQGFSRTVLVVRDRLDANKIREIIIRE